MALVDAVERVISALDLSQSDKAAAELARTYAQAMDAGICGECSEHRSLDVLGPKLLTALEALGASPRARAALTKGGGGHDSGGSELDKYRDRRRARQRDAEAVDPTAAGADA